MILNFFYVGKICLEGGKFCLVGRLLFYKLNRSQKKVDIRVRKIITNMYQLLPDEFGNIILHTAFTAFDTPCYFVMRRPTMIFLTGVVTEHTVNDHRSKGDVSLKDEMGNNKAKDISFWGVGIHLLSLSSCIL